ncbi:MAG: hypothetical protein A2Y40_10665 [Candidatus Margulisbacteria bacterium GWF2_35_9]|nr:MAG: hypothetical protein A2Y40_10665 [Candidatus Margulisbacteria bacterium GWF2_35_9]
MIRKNIQEENIVYGVDFGSSALKISVCELLDIHEFEVLTSMKFKYIGPMNKKLFDRERIKQFIERAFSRIDRELSVSTQQKKTIVTLPMAEYKTDIITVQTVVKNNLVKFENKIELINKAKEISSCGAILHTIPLKYTLDGESVPDPIGLQGEILQMDIFVIGYDEFLLEHFKSIFEELSIKVGKFVAPPLSFINYYLNFVPAQNKAQNILVIDFGSDVSYCYRIGNSQLATFHCLNLGSEIITNDIKNVLKISYDIAKKLKENHASLINKDDEEISIDGVNVQLSLLNEIVEARYDEILETYDNVPSMHNVDGDDIKIIVLGKGHPKGVDMYLENRWKGKIQSLAPYIADTNYMIAVGNIQYALNNEIYIPQIKEKQTTGIITRLIHIFEDLF